MPAPAYGRLTVGGPDIPPCGGSSPRSQDGRDPRGRRLAAASYLHRDSRTARVWLGSGVVHEGRAVVPIITPDQAIQAVNEAAQWLERIIKEKHRRNTKRAARILSSARILVVSLAAWAEAALLSVGPLEQFSDAWGKARRGRAITEIRDYVRGEPQAKSFRQSFGELQAFRLWWVRRRSRKEIKRVRNELVAIARDLWLAIQSRDSGPSPDLGRLLKAMELTSGEGAAADTMTDVQRVATKHLAYTHDLASRLTQRLGVLQGPIIEAYPDLVPPWTIETP